MVDILLIVKNIYNGNINEYIINNLNSRFTFNNSSNSFNLEI
jgi:hypothetical protein